MKALQGLGMLGLSCLLQACAAEVVPQMYGRKAWVGDRYSAGAERDERARFSSRVNAYWEEEKSRAAQRTAERERAAAQPPAPTDAESCVRNGRSPNPEFVRWQEQRQALDVQLQAIQAQISSHRGGAPEVQAETVESQSSHRSSDDFRRGERGATVVTKSQRETGASAGRRAGWSYELDRLLSDEEQVIARMRAMPSPPPPCNF